MKIKKSELTERAEARVAEKKDLFLADVDSLNWCRIADALEAWVEAWEPQALCDHGCPVPCPYCWRDTLQSMMPHYGGKG